jgi:hypothetical protein
MKHGYPWELLFHMQIYPGEVVFPLEVACQQEGSNCQAVAEVAYIGDFVHNQVLHHDLEEGVEVDPMIDVVASAPLKDSTFASCKLYKSEFHQTSHAIIGKVIPILMKSSLLAFQITELYFGQLKIS